jgi:CRISPR-associated endonuclease Csn1
VTINGEKLTVETKQEVYSQLFQKFKKVTQKRLKDFLLSRGIYSGDLEIGGIDTDFKESLASYYDFSKFIESKTLTTDQVERIINWIVLFGEDKTILRRKIESVMPSVLSESELKYVLALKYAGWGRFSREFLEDIVHVDKGSGECFNIINMLWRTNCNLMQLLSSNYDYLKEIETYNDLKPLHTVDYSVVDELQVSPAVKRQIWQTLQIVQELQKVMGHAPKKVFIEMARQEGEKKRTVSRKTFLQDLYKKCIEENFTDCSSEMRKQLDEEQESSLRSDRLFLYYCQLGHCMYTGNIIRSNDLFNVHLYDIDHIFPQSKTKDDSFDNRVLVTKLSNGTKSDQYPLDMAIQNKNYSFWKMLVDRKLISKKKFERLIRKEPFTPEEQAAFISRQIVETRQSTKAVAEILKRLFAESNTNIVYVKARNVSDF